MKYYNVESSKIYLKHTYLQVEQISHTLRTTNAAKAYSNINDDDRIINRYEICETYSIDI